MTLKALYEMQLNEFLCMFCLPCLVQSARRMIVDQPDKITRNLQCTGRSLYSQLEHLLPVPMMLTKLPQVWHIHRDQFRLSRCRQRKARGCLLTRPCSLHFHRLSKQNGQNVSFNGEYLISLPQRHSG